MYGTNCSEQIESSHEGEKKWNDKSVGPIHAQSFKTKLGPILVAFSHHQMHDSSAKPSPLA
jgi:hypothetical protein